LGKRNPKRLVLALQTIAIVGLSLAMAFVEFHMNAVMSVVTERPARTTAEIAWHRGHAALQIL
jgi:hypothetical protein